MTINNSLLNQIRTVALGLCLAPGLAHGQDDLDVTMRMVMDDESLDSAFVQEMEIPSSVNELDADTDFEPLDARELSDSARNFQETAASQARETRDALELELPSETTPESPEIDLPSEAMPESPEVGLPEVEAPETELPEPELPSESLPDLPTEAPSGDLPDTGLDLPVSAGDTVQDTLPD